MQSQPSQQHPQQWQGSGRRGGDQGLVPTRPSAAVLDRLTTDMQRLVDALAPPPETEARLAHLRSALLSAARERFEEADLHIYGSAANGFSLGGASDVDVCVVLPAVDEDGAAEAVQALADILTASTITVCLCSFVCVCFLSLHRILFSF